MLISRVGDEGEVEGGGQGVAPSGEPPATRAADELFEHMAKDSRFDPEEEETLTQRDLVLLYKNLDLGTQLMSNASVQQPRPNQRVETIVYKDKEGESEDSDISPAYSNEDLQSLYLMNKDQSRASSYTLCNKFGDLGINTSDLTVEYKRKFLFRDPYIQSQLQSINLFSSSSTLQGIVPTSLLDYICCKRLEDNYNFYMDNIIKYVQHTIEQLKRISNGDYLTEKVKEKWREVENQAETSNSDNTKVLATSTSIPLHVERKMTGHKSRWDDLVHSEVDIRSLSRILEKKIVIEIPKLISGSYKILSKCCVDNLILSCTKTKLSQVSEKTDSRVDVVFELKRSDSGHVISDISSIMIVQTSPCETNIQISSKENLPLTYLDKAEDSSVVSSMTQDRKSLHLIPIQDIYMDSSDVKEESHGSASEACTSHKIIELKDGSESSQIDIFDSKDGESECSSVVKYLSKNISADQFSTTLTSNDTESEPAKDGLQSDYYEHSLSATQPDDLASEKSLNGDQPGDNTEANFDFVSPDELGLSMRRLGMQGTLKEESEEDSDLKGIGKKKSQTKVRVKSPYENQSYVIEEKKRKRLLEIRERRERKKLAMQEFCKIVKHKYGKGFAMPQASSSVTKLSITNKSFYNSIYGQNTSVHNKQMRNKAHRRCHKRFTDVAAKKSSGGEHFDLSLSSMNSDRDNNKKFINRSYYLDEVETEMMNMGKDDDTERKGDLTERSDCNDFDAELDMLSKLMNPAGVVKIKRSNSSDVDKDSPEEDDDDEVSEIDFSGSESLSEADSGSSGPESRARLNVTPEPRRGPSSPTGPDYPGPDHPGPDHPGPDRSSTSLDCRRSIERVYDLLKRLGKTDYFLETRATGRSPSAVIDQRTVTRSDPATNPASDSGTSLRHLSSNSCQSFDINNAQKFEKRGKPRRTGPAGREPPKATSPRRCDRNKPGRLNVGDDKTTDLGVDPTKAFGRLVHDIDSLPNIPKTVKPVDVKATRSSKPPAADEPKTSPRQSYAKKPAPKVREPYVVPPELRPRKRPPGFVKRRIIDMIDEEKEARGEAVRGPSKCRLNALAQPRRTYVQAHIAEVQNKYGRSAISDRLQRLAGGPPPSPVNPKSKPLRKILPEAQMLRHGPHALRTTEPEKARARDVAAAGPSPRRAPPCPRPLGGEVESYVQLMALESSPEKLRARTVRDEDCLLDSRDYSLPESSPEPLRAMMTRVLAAPNLSDLTELTESSRSPRSPRSPRRRALSPCSGDYVDPLNTLPPPIEVKEEDDKETDSSRVSKSKSNLELAQLEAALCNRRAQSAVHNRLRIKNLTLTPRHSLQQLLALQSGDAVGVRTSFAEIKLFKSSEDLSILKSLTKEGRLEWNLDLRPQVATVGFSFTNFTKPLGAKGHLKSSSSGMTSADADHSKNRSSCSEAIGVDQGCKKTSDSTRSNTMSDGLFSQYCAPKEPPPPTMGEACVQADCKEFDELFEQSSNDDDRCLGKMVVDAMKTLVADAMVESAKLQQSDSRPISSKNWMTSGNSALTVVDKKADCRSVVDVGVGADEICGDAHPSQAKLPSAHTDHSAQTVDNDPSCDPADEASEKVCKSKVNSNNNAVEYSSSLDILVGLLNEIQTITTCQTNMTNKMVDKNRDQTFGGVFNQPSSRCIVNHVLSISSLDKMRQLESNPSIYSYYVSNASDYYGVESIKSEMIQTSCLMDKEVNTSYHSVPERGVVSRPTDVPSMLFYNIGLANFPSPLAIHQATSMGSLVLNQSVVSLHRHKSVSIAEVVADAPGDHVKSCVKTEIFEVNTSVRAKKTSSLSRKSDGNNRKSTVAKVKVGFAKGSDCDPLLKVKRDILVTVYSILVFTVFAALSFPDWLALLNRNL